MLSRVLSARLLANDSRSSPVLPATPPVARMMALILNMDVSNVSASRATLRNSEPMPPMPTAATASAPRPFAIPRRLCVVCSASFLVSLSSLCASSSAPLRPEASPVILTWTPLISAIFSRLHLLRVGFARPAPFTIRKSTTARFFLSV